jgi:hypothetical protein
MQTKLIRFTPSTHAPDGDTYLYALMRDTVAGSIFARLLNLRSFDDADHATSYLGSNFHPGLVNFDLYQEGESLEIRIIKFVPQTTGPGGDTFLYTILSSSETKSATARLENLRCFDNEEHAKEYLANSFHPEYSRQDVTNWI